MNATPDPLLQSKMQALRSQFVARCGADRALLQAWLDGPVDGGDSIGLDALRRIAHRMAGAAAVFGFHELAAGAEALEDATREKPPRLDDVSQSGRAVVNLLATLHAEG